MLGSRAAVLISMRMATLQHSFASHHNTTQHDASQRAFVALSGSLHNQLTI